MTLIDLIPIAVVALVCGAAGQITSGFSRNGWIMHTAIALLGAIGGVALARTFNFPLIFSVMVGGSQFPLLWSLLGATALVAVISLLLKPRR